MSGRVFISYSHTDAAAADQIYQRLAAEGLAPWIDRREMQPGDSFVERMNAGLQSASYVCLLVSQASLESKWVSREWMSSLANEDVVLVPFLLESCPLPPLLRDVLHIDASGDLARGIEALLSFLRRETNPALAARTVQRSGAPNPLAGTSRRELRLVAAKCLDDAALNAFLFDAEIERGRLAGNSVHERLVCLLHLVADEGILEQFVDWLSRERQRCVVHQLAVVRQEPSWRLPG